MTIFRFVCIWILLTYAAKVIFNIYSRNRFYEWARSLFAQKMMPFMLRLIIVNLFYMFGLVLYGAIYHYPSYGWVIMVPICFGVLEALALLFAWPRVAPIFVKFIDSAGKKLWLYDMVESVAVIGVGLLGFFVY
jgi:hypothetical protein